MARNREIDERPFEIELRQAEGEAPRLEGYAVVFGSMSRDLGGFREIIEQGAFAEALLSGPDVRALFNHDSNMVLGRTTNGTLMLAEDAHGLRVSLAMPDTAYARDVYKLVERGDVNQMSFAFKPRKGGETWATEQGQRVRRVRNSDIYDVSVVTYPAYEATSVAARALEMAQAMESDGRAADEIEHEARSRAAARARARTIEILSLED